MLGFLCYEQVDDKLYIYLEYVSGGSIYKILQDYGRLGENAIRSYTQQILSGLEYLHAKNTVHRLVYLLIILCFGYTRSSSYLILIFMSANHLGSLLCLRISFNLVQRH